MDSVEFEKLVTVLMLMMELNGLPIDSKSKMRNFIYHAFNDNRIKFFDKGGKQAGFMMWEVHDKDIYVSHLVILQEFKNFNLKQAATFLKDKYKIGNTSIYWHNQRRNKKVDFNKKELVYG